MIRFVQLKYWEIEEIWRHHLWPNRISAIEPFSAMRYLGGIDMSIADQYQGTERFIGFTVLGELIGVNSIHRTDPDVFRSRGLYVRDEYRSLGLGVKLLQESVRQAKEQGAKRVWSFPRHSSQQTYKKAGFTITSDWIDDGEFGPNAYAEVTCG